jgi:hypothetical protein
MYPGASKAITNAEGATAGVAGTVAMTAVLEAGFAGADPQGAQEEAAYEQWFDQEAERRDGRRARLAEAAPFVPGPLWVVLIRGAVLTIAYMCAQADRWEGVVIESLTIGFVTLLTASLLVVAFLDRHTCRSKALVVCGAYLTARPSSRTHNDRARGCQHDDSGRGAWIGSGRRCASSQVLLPET